MGVYRNLQISHSFSMRDSQELAFPDQNKQKKIWRGLLGGVKSTCLHHIANNVFKVAGGIEKLNRSIQIMGQIIISLHISQTENCEIQWHVDGLYCCGQQLQLGLFRD